MDWREQRDPRCIDNDGLECTKCAMFRSFYEQLLEAAKEADDV
jgi:hypothetical protein